MHEAFRRRADIISSTAIHLLVNAWPNNWLNVLERCQVGIVGEAGGRAWWLAEAFGGAPVPWSDALPAAGGIVIADVPKLPNGLADWVAQG
jgi:hypothetical protein